MGVKVDLDKVMMAAFHHVKNEGDRRNMLADIGTALNEVRASRAPGGQVDKRAVAIVNPYLGEFLKDDVGFVVKILSSEDPETISGRMHGAAQEFNESPRGRRLPVETVGEVLENVPARILASHGLWAAIKEPVSFVGVSNRIDGLLIK